MKISTEAELIRVNNMMPQMLWTMFFMESIRMKYLQECIIPRQYERVDARQEK